MRERRKKKKQGRKGEFKASSLASSVQKFHQILVKVLKNTHALSSSKFP
jgi:hypothetical protein